MIEKIASYAVCTYILFVFIKYTICIIAISSIERIRKNRISTNNFKSETNVKAQLGNEQPFRFLLYRIYEGTYRYFNFKLSNFPSNNIRNFFYRNCFLIEIEKNVVINKGLEIRGGYRIKIGKGSVIGDDVLLDGRGGLEIGEYVNFSSNSSVYTREHDVNDIAFCSKQKGVCIKDRAWISSNSIVLPGVKIGTGAVLAAGAVATKDLDDFYMYGGIPAKKISKRNTDINYTFAGKPLWFM